MRKLSADWIFDGHQLHRGGVLVLEDNGIVADLLPQAAGPDSEYFSGLLCPGFINAHCHLELSHLKGLVPKGTGLVDFILTLQRARFKAGPREKQEAMARAEDEMLAEGIVAVGDIANSDVSFPVKARSKLEYHTFLEVFGFDPDAAGRIFSDAQALRARFPEGDRGGGRPGKDQPDMVPHAPYSVSRKLFELIGSQHAQQEGGRGTPLISVHNQESVHEDPFYLDGTGDFTRLYQEFGIDISFYRPYGKRALSSWLPWLGPDSRKLLVHNTYTTALDIDFALQQGETWWCLCPNANLYIEQKLPDIPLFVRKGLKLVLGTDSLASNDRLSILEEMKTLLNHFPAIGLEQLLQWATRNAAEYFGWEHRGSFSKGKRPGVNLLTGIGRDKRITKHTRVTPLLLE